MRKLRVIINEDYFQLCIRVFLCNSLQHVIVVMRSLRPSNSLFKLSEHILCVIDYYFIGYSLCFKLMITYIFIWLFCEGSCRSDFLSTELLRTCKLQIFRTPRSPENFPERLWCILCRKFYRFLWCPTRKFSVLLMHLTMRLTNSGLRIQRLATVVSHLMTE